MKMKKIFLLICLVLIGFESISQAKVSVGLKAGVNFSNLDISPAPSTSFTYKTNFHFGAFAQVKISKFGIQPEVIVSKQGATTTFFGNEASIYIDYVNVPVVFKWYPGGGFNFQIGPQFSFLSEAKKDFLVVSNGNVVSKTKVDMNLKSNDLGFVFGLGWESPVGLTFEGRYILGTTNINNAQNTSEQIKNQVIQFSLGYKLFKFGK